MITEKEIQAARLSPTKKDFYQIWNELIDTAGKISERWDPSSTNESDPGIVLLKVLTGIADKLNYNIDKDILEAFMPSATQQESMRKLCDMMGYNIKYFQSAETSATITYTGSSTSTEPIVIPKYTVLTNVDNTITFVTTKDKTLVLNGTDSLQVKRSESFDCIEGVIVQCETANDNIVTIDLIDDNHRFYLPEYQIAENGIYIYNYVVDTTLKTEWEKVDNLNTVIAGRPVYKFGFDSKLQMPYIQFPEDIATLIEDGLEIWYIRTSGNNGNISARTLSSISGFGATTAENSELLNALNIEDFTVTNTSAAVNGRNIETINEAYNNYKKTIGTFDTLVTCRDYMNKIYQLMDDYNNPLVSNVIVSDIRDDINRAYTLCSFCDYGIKYLDKAVKEANNSSDKISNFDLVLYPFRTVKGLNSKNEYINSFMYTEENLALISNGIAAQKTLSHKETTPTDGEITCIKNYLKLSAKITTTTKVNATEQKNILQNIYTAICANFNMRKLDFGEEIPFDAILECIEEADTRIKNVSLEEPELSTYVQILVAGVPTEYPIDIALATEEQLSASKKYSNQLALRNVLAGRVKMFNYKTDFKRELNNAQYANYAPVYPTTSDKHITKLTSSCEIPTSGISEDTPVKLSANEAIQFRAPNFKTTLTYPAYVNYRIRISANNITPQIPATFQTFRQYLTDRTNELNDINANMFKEPASGETLVYTINGTTATKAAPGTENAKAVKLDDSVTFNYWFDWVLKQASEEGDSKKLQGLYHRLDADRSRQIGYMVDYQYFKYQRCDYARTIGSEDPLIVYFVQKTFNAKNDSAADMSKRHTKDGFGQTRELGGIDANSEYQLNGEDALWINYTESSSTDEETSTETIKSIKYTAGTIIRPNFLLSNSEDVHEQGTSYSKTDVDFTKYGDGYLDMFTMDANQQIEIRDIAHVTLDKGYYLYWSLNDGSTTFPISAENPSYLLKENEYLYFTDEDKLDMAYYGFGTEVTYNGTFPQLDNNGTSLPTAEEIIEGGLNVIPWVYKKFTSADKAVITEYQYINLAADDKLTSIALTKPTVTSITNEYTNVSSATYIQGGTAGSLPKLTNITLPETTTAASWQVRSKLEFNMGPNLSQTLYNTRDIITLHYKESGTQPLQPTSDTPLVLRSNYQVQQSMDTVDVSVKDADDKAIDNFSILTAKRTDVKYPSEKEVNFNNLGAYWTSINLSDMAISTSDKKIVISTMIADNETGLLMFYTNMPGEEKITITADNSATLQVINSTAAAASTLELTTNGIFVVQISKSCNLTIKAKEAKQGILILGQLDIVPVAGKMNPLLGYYAIDKATAYEQLLSDIKAIVDENTFYYNTVIDNSLAIDMDETADPTDKANMLSAPKFFYDYNNINNKFVISEISYTDMTSGGITIARSSKL